MGKILVSQFISLDGVIEAPETWHFPYLSDDMAEDAKQGILDSDAFLYGRVTYQDFASFWPTQVNNEFGFADKLNKTRKIVVSKTLETASWENSVIVRTLEELAKIKQEIAGTIAMTGSGQLIQSLAKADLVDEYRLMVHPIVVGKGQKLFGEGLETIKLKLLENKTYASGAILLRFAPDRG